MVSIEVLSKALPPPDLTADIVRILSEVGNSREMRYSLQQRYPSWVLSNSSHISGADGYGEAADHNSRERHNISIT
ncbi:hypothetical protein RRG08_064478 [Elysia crispata]|uniref:Uncharacterized protein n=1 Tax=Elysia crispata TaxID=231223 RepID=A0AAE1AE81_9GAST|nr:hypothetical protein RRG08_064478 [Elysia crispata]